MNDRYVLITGASSGIGRACALLLDASGFSVFACVRTTKDGEALEEQASSRLIPIFLDVTKPQSIADAVTEVEKRVGDEVFWGLVNNAGISIAGPVELLSIETYRHQFDVNLFGQIKVIKAFLPLLRKSRGRIVNMSSMSGRFGSPFLSPYSASKHSFEALSDSLRRELIPTGIKVAIIEPGSTRTNIQKKALDRAVEEIKSSDSNRQGVYDAFFDVKRLEGSRIGKGSGSPRKVAKAVEHALSSKHPRIRYPVGWDAKLVIWASAFLPDRFMDWMVEKWVYSRRSIIKRMMYSPFSNQDVPNVQKDQDAH